MNELSKDKDESTFKFKTLLSEEVIKDENDEGYVPWTEQSDSSLLGEDEFPLDHNTNLILDDNNEEYTLHYSDNESNNENNTKNKYKCAFTNILNIQKENKINMEYKLWLNKNYKELQSAFYIINKNYFDKVKLNREINFKEFTEFCFFSN
jgi:hypothetical protein